jgi:predicted HTH transcriptional regulator
MSLARLSKDELIKIIDHEREERNIEYKPSMPWEKTNKKRFEVIKCILGMANIRDGGFIVFGVEQRDGRFIQSGMIPDHIMSFDQDKIDDVVKDFADPFVETHFTVVEYKSKEFVVIQVNEFDEIPVICKDNHKLEGKVFLREGAIYNRPRGKSETTEVSTQAGMREIIDMAVDKSLHRFVERVGRIVVSEITGLMMPKVTEEKKFEDQEKSMR